MFVDREIRTTFGKISELYEKARINYPELLIKDIIKFSKLEKGNKILDIGCGGGQATILFGEKNFDVIGLDPGPDLIDIARRKCSEFSNVNFKVGNFEDVDSLEKSFNLIICGMAWHWVLPEIRYEKTYKILEENGILALFWSNQEKEVSKFVLDVANILDKYGKINSGPAGSRVREIAQQTYDELKLNNLFTLVEFKEYKQELEFTKEKYLNLVISYGWFQVLPEERKENLISELLELFKKYNEPLIIPYNYSLILAKKN